MKEITEILVAAGALLYMLLVCAADAFDDLSGGRVRKIEEKKEADNPIEATREEAAKREEAEKEEVKK